ncbi:hypothetical protein HPB49_022107 [Dermacentor silvarum]|uniref:Uncharacterized protein n=1 Tax=Dermacentor silvarum TaxID=543639 RepID=A0ACB8DL88_DERSI|nr:hypothetical protein HPB49_022107 [Dermacentor silvarum]
MVSSRVTYGRDHVAVVVSFIICWTPFHAQRLIATYADQTAAMVLLFTVLTYISGVTYYLSATVNPILYQVMSLKFRQAFVDTFGCCCPEVARSKANADLTFASFYNHNSAASVHSSARTHRRRSLSTQNLSLTAATTMSPTQLAAPNNAFAPNGSAAPVRKMSSSWTDLRNLGGSTDAEGTAGVAAVSSSTTSNRTTQQCVAVADRDASPAPEVVRVAEV